MKELARRIAINLEGQQEQLTVNRMAFYHRMKVIEAVDINEHTTYLLFYKNHFIIRQSLQPITGSLLEQVFQNGIVFNAPHPLIQSYCSKHQHFHRKNTDQVLNMLDKVYNPQEISLILAFFDSFLTKETIQNYMKKYYYHYRRSGKLRLAYQLLMLMLVFDPNDTWALDMSKHLDYIKHQAVYNNRSVLYEKDPLYAEVSAFLDRTDMANFQYLEAMLAREKRWLDLIALYIDEFRRTSQSPSKELYNQFTSVTSVLFSGEDYAYLLWDTYKQIPTANLVQKDLIRCLMKLDRREDAVNIVLEQPLPLSSHYRKQLELLFDSESLDMKKINLQKLLNYLTFDQNAESVNKILSAAIPILLDSYTLHYVYELLLPLYKLDLANSSLEKLQRMVILQDDPDHQLDLGVLYQEFKQYEKAIECYNWEVEMDPMNPSPVEKLTKVYRDLGLLEEAKQYMYLYSSLQDAANS